MSTVVARTTSSTPRAKPVSAKNIRDAEASVGGWLLELIDGSGNSPSQIIVTAVLGCVPVVGQLFDLRDLIRCIIAIVAAPASPWAWVELLITLIGCIPGLGDGFKAAFKLAKSGGAKPARVFDAMRAHMQVDPRAALRQLDWGKVKRESPQLLNGMIDGMIRGLDGWGVEQLAGRQQVGALVRSLREVKRDAPTMLSKAADELKKIADELTGAAPLKSSAQVNPRLAAPPLPAAAGKGKSTGSGAKDQTGNNVPGRGAPNPHQIRQSKRKRWSEGVAAEHITEYHVRTARPAVRKINDHGRLTEEWERSKKVGGAAVRVSAVTVQGIDHLWFGPHRGRKYTVGETKGSTFAHFSFLAGMAAGDREAVEATRTDTGKVLGGKGEYTGKEAMTPDKPASSSVPIRDESALASSKGGGGTLSTNKTKGRQMGHRWVRQSLEADSTVSSAHKEHLLESIRRSLIRKRLPDIYHRELFMVTGKQYEIHDRARGKTHLVQPPVVLIPDDVLVE
ncbi:hypothetical protein [Cognatilysobacter bugurensis]|uniref:Uncharacterized protein n=1 Tax=Cognatilysobacter bugurensis TaxID=543356 RepID=A0A918T3N2_9GAMM|nr:hypothetical protein [Lysobacter bugurensis]GHA82298.1 hypothetical protein GCM10007067_20310 [Lysobacter bugurensis]